jgi:divalent metal cation (Fe/Co/Zn/Cd) transporter
LAQRIALAALAIFLMLNAVTPFITPDPPWLANLPLVVAIMAFLLAFGLSHAERSGLRQVLVQKRQ